MRNSQETKGRDRVAIAEGRMRRGCKQRKVWETVIEKGGVLFGLCTEQHARDEEGNE
jgi:hypothetical protein